MEQGPYSEAYSCLSTQEIPQISRNRNFRFSSNKMSELIPNPSKMNPPQVFTLCIFNVLFNILNSTHTSVNVLNVFLILKTKTHTIAVIVM
jgi:hypothetical protein